MCSLSVLLSPLLANSLHECSYGLAGALKTVNSTGSDNDKTRSFVSQCVEECLRHIVCDRSELTIEVIETVNILTSTILNSSTAPPPKPQDSFYSLLASILIDIKLSHFGGDPSTPTFLLHCVATNRHVRDAISSDQDRSSNIRAYVGPSE